MTHSLRIRAATPADAEVIADFNAALAWETESLTLDRGRLRPGVAAVLLDPGKGRYWVAEIEGEVIGQLLLTFEWSDWRHGNFWWIQSVYVRPDSRGRGVFKALFNHVRTLAATTPEVCGLRLYVETHNTAAKVVYHRLGMKSTSYELLEIDQIFPAGSDSTGSPSPG